MDDKKCQWSKFSPDRSEQFVIRTDSYEEMLELRAKVLGIVPQTKAFPDDEGHIATPPEKTQTEAPKCGIHGTPMRERQGKFGMFWSCGTKNADGSWCKYRPA